MKRLRRKWFPWSATVWYLGAFIYLLVDVMRVPTPPLTWPVAYIAITSISIIVFLVSLVGWFIGSSALGFSRK